jgi:hypothetical protein
MTPQKKRKDCERKERRYYLEILHSNIKTNAKYSDLKLLHVTISCRQEASSVVSGTTEDLSGG